MYRLILFLFLLSSVSFSLKAQSELNFRLVEDSSLSMYSHKNWKQLLVFGNKAINNKIDYYYLRYRMGIAAYELQKYQIALIHFRKAYQYNSFEDKLKEYIYYSLVFSSRYDEALRFSKHFSDSLLTVTKTKRPAFINLIQLEGGVKTASSNVKVQPFKYINLTINNRIGKGISLLHSFTYLNQQGFYGTVKQVQYYAALGISFNKGFVITPTFHFISSDFVSAANKNNDNRTSYFLGSLEISKQFPFVKLDLINSLSNFNNAYQIQNGLGITLFPLANQKLSLGLLVTEYTGDNYQTYSPMYQASLRVSPHRNFTFSAIYTNAQTRYFNEFNGYLVNNSYDILRSKFILSPELTIQNKVIIYAAFVHENKTVFNSKPKLDYTYNGISAGIKIKL